MTVCTACGATIAGHANVDVSDGCEEPLHDTGCQATAARASLALLNTRWVAALQVVLMLTATTGLCWLLSSSYHNHISCVGAPAGSGCAPLSLLPAQLLIAIGITGFAATRLAANIWAVRRFGFGWRSLRRLQRSA